MADAHRGGGRVRRESLVVEEHTSVQVGRGLLTAADLRRLQRLRDEGRIGLREARSGWTLSARATVGVLVLDQVRLVLSPKMHIPGERLITWLCYAQGTPVPHDPILRRWLIGGSGYAEIALAALLAECRKLLRDGLRRDYVPAERVEPVLRGRLDVRAQVTRGYGAVDRLHVRTFERDERVWENLVCAAALSKAIDRAADRKLARTLTEAAARFPRPPHPDEAAGMLARARYNRLNDRYRPAHAWARLILGGGGVTDLLTERGLPADSMLLNMNVLWERVVRQLAGDAAAEFGGQCQRSDADPGIRTSGDIGKANKRFVPDVLLRFPGQPPRVLPIDAKYKTYAGKSVSSEDRHQLLTYIAGYAAPDTPLAAVVYPAPQGEHGRTLTITGPRGHRLGVIELLGLDTRLPPHQATASLRALTSRFAAGSVPS